MTFSSAFPPLTNVVENSELLDWMQHRNKYNPSTTVNKQDGCKVLLVGAGGIGCEVLKNLALSGFCEVTVMDLDTIDVSNLNRQLLFRSQHVGHPKCTTAAQVASQMMPPNDAIQYKAILGNVCDTSLVHVGFVKGFDVVINALDNLTARRRVNRLCLAAQVPLVEAGTTGYLGQTHVIYQPSDGAATSCYECKTVETPKVYPICTIRSTPSRPVHTIVWAKEFYKLLFHPQVQESMLYEPDEETNGEPSTYMKTVHQVREVLLKNNETSSASSTSSTALIRTLIRTLYCDEIQKQLSLDRYKAALQPPKPLNQLMDWKEEDQDETTATAASPSHTDVSYWQVPDHCVAQLTAVLQQCCGVTHTFPESFDKDHDGAMLFVTAASNLRNLVFSIQPIQSLYSAKGIAGNIIPAIATTNAIAAGLQMIQVYRVLEVILARKQQKLKENNTDKSVNANEATLPSVLDRCCYSNILRNPTRNGLVITAVKLDPPNPNCFVCRQGTVELTCNTQRWTLQHLVERVLQQELGLQEPSITIGTAGALIWEQGPDSDQELFQVNWTKSLADLPAGGITNGSIVHVDDFTQSLEMSIHVSHIDAFEDVSQKQEEEGGTTTEKFPFLLKGSTSKGSSPTGNPTDASTTNPSTAGKSQTVSTKDSQDNDDDEDIVLVVRNKSRDENKKRKTGTLADDNHPEGESNDSRSNKRQRLDEKDTTASSSSSAPSSNAASSVQVIVIDD